MAHHSHVPTPPHTRHLSQRVRKPPDFYKPLPMRVPVKRKSASTQQTKAAKKRVEKQESGKRNEKGTTRTTRTTRTKWDIFNVYPEMALDLKALFKCCGNNRVIVHGSKAAQGFIHQVDGLEQLNTLQFMRVAVYVGNNNNENVLKCAKYISAVFHEVADKILGPGYNRETFRLRCRWSVRHNGSKTTAHLSEIPVPAPTFNYTNPDQLQDFLANKKNMRFWIKNQNLHLDPHHIKEFVELSIPDATYVKFNQMIDPLQLGRFMAAAFQMRRELGGAFTNGQLGAGFHGTGKHTPPKEIIKNGGLNPLYFRDNNLFGRGLYIATSAKYPASGSSFRYRHLLPNGKIELLLVWYLAGRVEDVGRRQDGRKIAVKSGEFHSLMATTEDERILVVGEKSQVFALGCVSFYSNICGAPAPAPVIASPTLTVVSPKPVVTSTNRRPTLFTPAPVVASPTLTVASYVPVATSTNRRSALSTPAPSVASPTLSIASTVLPAPVVTSTKTLTCNRCSRRINNGTFKPITGGVFCSYNCSRGATAPLPTTVATQSTPQLVVPRLSCNTMPVVGTRVIATAKSLQWWYDVGDTGTVVHPVVDQTSPRFPCIYIQWSNSGVCGCNPKKLKAI